MENEKRGGLISYPLILPGREVCIRLYLPPDLTLREVERLTAFLKTLVIPEGDDGLR